VVKFHDAFTGTVYEVGNQWLDAAFEQVASLLRAKIQGAGGSLRQIANQAASFWREDYHLPSTLLSSKRALEIPRGFPCR